MVYRNRSLFREKYTYTALFCNQTTDHVNRTFVKIHLLIIYNLLNPNKTLLRVELRSDYVLKYTLKLQLNLYHSLRAERRIENCPVQHYVGETCMVETRLDNGFPVLELPANFRKSYTFKNIFQHFFEVATLLKITIL